MPPTDPLTTTGSLTIIPIRGVPEVTAGAELGQVLHQAMSKSGITLTDGDIIVIASKVVSKARGFIHHIPKEVVIQEKTRRVVSARRSGDDQLIAIVESEAGPVMAAAGVDTSNTPAGTVLSLPPKPDEEASAIRWSLRALGAPQVAIVISDTFGRPWRNGQVDLALGVAGMTPIDDLRGGEDAHGQSLSVTMRAIADELASAADLVKGKNRGYPAAVIRGLGQLVTAEEGPGAQAMIRLGASDQFRLGHVEAVRAALGHHPLAIEPPATAWEGLTTRLLRAWQLAKTGAVEILHCDLLITDQQADQVSFQTTALDPWTAGLLTGRLLTAAWAEDLSLDVQSHPAVGRASHSHPNIIMSGRTRHRAEPHLPVNSHQPQDVTTPASATAE
ncbi:MAG: coenzyme F420-0:L-glutamate ligase [Actinomycetota bacterium]